MATSLQRVVEFVASGSEIYNRQKNDVWFKSGESLLKDTLKLKQINGKAKNVILFLGDGMGISTVTAARILEGQLRGKSGEEGFLSWERFPYAALSKTYNTDQQTADSAGTATAFMTGVKSKAGVISVDDQVVYSNCKTASKATVLSMVELAELKGLSTGIVTTARLTHATPSTGYAHSASRRWENDAELQDKSCSDIVRNPLPYSGSCLIVIPTARQLIEFPYGDGLEVAMGGGRRNFLTNSTVDPEYNTTKGRRKDGRNLAEEWMRKTKANDKWSYVWNEKQFKALDVNKVNHVLGLFEPSHMRYAADRMNDGSGEPSLTNMTEFAINMLSKNKKGFFLLAEGGRIDHGHHAGNAYNALHDAVELANAVAKAQSMTKEEETLIIVTADHSHTFMIAGYPKRGNPILGLASSNTASDKKKWTTLGYLNGPGAKKSSLRDDPALSDTTAKGYKQQSLVPFGSETHGGEDVGIYARGPRSHMLHGVVEQNYIFHVMDYALCLSEGKEKICKEQDALNGAAADTASEIYNRQKNDPWFKSGESFIKDTLKLKQMNGKAKNVILFLGDGMGISTVTAARILEGQLRGKSGEEGYLSWEKFPYSALSKTYNTNQQTPDSAGTATAFMTGVKSKAGVISVDDNIQYGKCHSFPRTTVLSMVELAELKGLSTGIVTTARLTHATPSTGYAHSASRKWESDADMSDRSCVDIARQLIEFPYGNGLEVALGGGRRNFLPSTSTDPEYGTKGRRRDGRNLAQEWMNKTTANDKWSYVWNDQQFKALDVNSVDHLLGLFEPSHMRYAAMRKYDKSGEPSLTEMTELAINMLSKNDKGYFMLVEGGRIDHGHHAGNAYNALHDAVELANAVAKAQSMTKEEETLIIVTADHSHTFVIGGYPKRGNPILGLASTRKARDGKPWTTLAYMNGPGAKTNALRDDPSKFRTDSRLYRQQSLVPLPSETHGGEDVGIYARGPRSHMLHGVVEQNYIFHVMDYALCLSEGKAKICKEQGNASQFNAN
eukprot:gene12975-14309_t